MTWTTVYENVNGSLWVPYDWKMDHEYIVFLMAAHRDQEMDHCQVFTMSSALNAGDRGFSQRAIDCWVIFDQVTKGIRSVEKRGPNCPILKIIERPVAFGTASVTGENENWEHFWSGYFTADAPIRWEDDYEYVCFVRAVQRVGPYNNLKFISQGHTLCPAEIAPYNNGQIGNGELYHVQIFNGWLRFFRSPNNPTNVANRKMSLYDVPGGIVHVMRRPIRLIAAPDDKYNGWQRVLNHLPNGRQFGGAWHEAIPFAWEMRREYATIYVDTKGTDELSCGNLYTDDILEDPAVKSRWNWILLATESGSSAQFSFAPTWFNNRGYKQMFTWGADGPRVLTSYVKTPVVALPPPIPPDPPEPPGIPCEDRCYIVGDVWEQTATMEVRFVKPDDWASRTYEYQWGGDIGNGELFLVETLEGGRVAKLKLVRTLLVTDAAATLSYTVSVKVIDEQYRQLGMSDTDEGIITFELPACVIEGNDPDISIEDLTLVELHVNRSLDVRVTLSEPYIGTTPLCVDWTTRDGTATSDLSVRALAKDDLELPHVMIIENVDSSRRMYLDGAFPKFYNGYWNDRASVPKYMNTLTMLKNIMNWLSGSKTGGAVLFMGDAGVTGQAYDVKDAVGYSGFSNYFTEAALQTGRTLTTLYGNECVETQAFFDSFDCVLYISSAYTGGQVNSPALIAAMKASHFNGQGIGLIADHGADGDPSGIGFYKGANEILFDFYNIKFKGSIDRGAMNLTVEDAKLENGDHPIWAGMTGQMNSGDSEAYVDAVNSVPDYIAASGQICFASGESEKIVTVELIGDTVLEDTEQFTIELSNNTRGVLVKPVGTITIVDDDAVPCGLETPAGGAGVTENFHNLGSVAGTVNVDYTMYSVPDAMEIYYEGALVATTGGPVSGSGTLSFFYPGPPNQARCLIRVSGPDGTAWTYNMNCPIP